MLEAVGFGVVPARSGACLDSIIAYGAKETKKGFQGWRAWAIPYKLCCLRCYQSSLEKLDD